MKWFEADKDGLRQIAERMIERRGFGIIGAELYQNTMDTNATECKIAIEKLPGRPVANLTVEDNDPTGFPDLTHAYTMFAPSLKKVDPTKAGRFNVGEKVVLAFCNEATIHTTKGTVEFTAAGRTDYPRRKRDVGTAFWAQIRCNAEQYDQFLDYMSKIIVRPGLKLIVNGTEIPHRQPFKTFEAKLATEIAGDNGELRRTVRTCEVQLFEALPDRPAMLYELGIPVVETGDKYEYNVLQKVPLNVDRDNVPEAYLRDLRTFVFNQTFDMISEEDTTSLWVNEAAGDDKCEPEAAQSFKVKKYGEKAVAADPNNPEANAEAMAHGYTVIPSRGLTKGQRQNLASNGYLISSTKQFPTAGTGAYSDDPDAKPVEFIPEDEWTKGMESIHEYTEGLGYRLLGKRVNVAFVKVKSFPGKPWAACYGRGHLLGESEFHYNLAQLGKEWFNHGVNELIDRLIIHEMAHEFESNHLCEEYYRALCTIGANLKAFALKDPKWFNKFIH